MRSPQVIVGCVLCASASLAGCATTGSEDPADPAAVPGEFDPAKVEREARAAARREIAEGRPVMWEIGRMPAGTDPETGLPAHGFTCLFSPENELARDAHNDEIRRAFRAGEIR